MAWLNREWFTLEALAAEWRRKDILRCLIGVATTAVVLALLCHPDGAPTAMAIDSLGVDAFLALLELQLLVSVALHREQITAFLRTAYVGDSVLGTVMRKSVALPRCIHAALRGDFR